MNFLQHWDRFAAFMRDFNDERPHEALAKKRPVQLYAPSPRLYDDLPKVANPAA